MNSNQSFEHAVISGEIQGPSWKVIEIDTGIEKATGSQDFQHTRLGREVRILKGGIRIGYVEDYQHPADTPQDARDAEVAYNTFDAHDPYAK